MPALVYTLKQLKKMDIDEKAQQEEQLDQFSDYDQTGRLTQLTMQLQSVAGHKPDKICQFVVKALQDLNTDDQFNNGIMMGTTVNEALQ